jgi:hypothetical protein
MRKPRHTFMYIYYLYVHIFIRDRCMLVMIRFYPYLIFDVYYIPSFFAGNHLFRIIYDEEKGGVWRYLVRYCMEYYP